jgi:hypothetical protein
LTRISSLIKPVLQKLVPTDKQRLSQDNLQISLTRFVDLGHVQKSDFESKKEVVDTIIASLANPFTSCSVGGTRYFSGAYSKKSVVFDRHTLTVSGKVDCANICPVVEFNTKEELEPSSDASVYRDMVTRGYEDCAKWFEKRWNANVLDATIKRVYANSVQEESTFVHPRKQPGEWITVRPRMVKKVVPKSTQVSLPTPDQRPPPSFGAFYY